MIKAILQELARFGLTVGQEAADSMNALIRAHGELLLAQASVVLAESTGMPVGEIRKRKGTVQTCEAEVTLCWEDMKRFLPIALQSPESGLLGWAISQAVLLVGGKK